MISQREREICQRKVTYNNYTQAVINATRINKKYPSHQQGPYKCPVCGRYHLSKACRIDPSRVKFPSNWDYLK